MSIFKRNKANPNKPFTSAVIAAAGSSLRMGGADKLQISLSGLPIIVYSLLAFEKNSAVDEIVICAREDAIEDLSRICMTHKISKALSIVKGAGTRLESVMNGVFAVSGKAELIAIHDGARPLVTQTLISDTIAMAARCGAAIPAVPVKATIKALHGDRVENTPDRKILYEAQTPQVFNAALIKAALTNVREKGIEVTDDASAAEILGAEIYVAEGSDENIKITLPQDIYTAEGILKMRNGIYV